MGISQETIVAMADFQARMEKIHSIEQKYMQAISEYTQQLNDLYKYAKTKTKQYIAEKKAWLMYKIEKTQKKMTEWVQSQKDKATNWINAKKSSIADKMLEKEKSAENAVNSFKK